MYMIYKGFSLSSSKSDDQSPAMPEPPPPPLQTPIWIRLSDDLFPLLFFPLTALALYCPAMADAPRGDHVILWEIFRGLDWRWSELDRILFIGFLDKPRFQPLMFFLHFLQAKLFGQTFWLYHLVSVVLHGLNAFLLFRIAHMLGDEGGPVPVPAASLAAGADSFVLRFGFIAVVRHAGAATLETFTPEGGCAASGRYLDFVFDDGEPTLAEDQVGAGRLVFGRCRNGKKTVLFESDPVAIEFNRLNLFEFGRVRDR
jgi:hypothetical protein